MMYSTDSVLFTEYYERCRKEIGWVCTRPHYCQLIREANKLKRKEWCQKQLSNNEQFENVIFTGIYTATVLNIGV